MGWENLYKDSNDLIGMWIWSINNNIIMKFKPLIELSEIFYKEARNYLKINDLVKDITTNSIGYIKEVKFDKDEKVCLLGDKWIDDKLLSKVDPRSLSLNYLEDYLLKSYSLYEDIVEWESKNSNIIEPLLGGGFYYDRDHDYIVVLLKMQSDIIISNKKEKNLIVSEELIIPKHKTVPNIFVYKKRQHESGVVMKHLSNIAGINEWIIPILYQLEGSLYPEETKKFFIQEGDNLKKLYHWIKKKPLYLGGGAGGVAFDVGDNKVFKLFRNAVEYEKAVEAQEVIFNRPDIAKTEAMIYDVGILGEYYYTVSEKMTPVPGGDIIWEFIESEVLPRIKNSMWEIINSKRLPTEEEREYKIQGFIRYFSSIGVPREIIEEAKKRELKDNWFRLYVEEVIRKLFSDRGDLHGGNIGYTTYGELRYFDPTFPGWENRLNY